MTCTFKFQSEAEKKLEEIKAFRVRMKEVADDARGKEELLKQLVWYIIWDYLLNVEGVIFTEFVNIDLSLPQSILSNLWKSHQFGYLLIKKVNDCLIKRVPSMIRIYRHSERIGVTYNRGKARTGKTHAGILYLFSFLTEETEIMQWSNGNNKRNYQNKAAVKKSVNRDLRAIGIDR